MRNGQSWKMRGDEEWAVVEGEGGMRGDEEWAVVEGEGG